MKLETFFEQFDLFADAPDAVARMRELVLWSAFSGAFSAEERTQPMPTDWAKDGAPELPAIPSSWKWQRGSDVFDVIRGVSYKKTDASEVPIEGSFPLLRANNIGTGINFDELVYVPRDNIRDEQFVRRGDILIAMSSGSKRLVGKAAPIITEFDGAFGAFCGVIRNKSEIPNDVLARYFQTPQYSSWVIAAGRGIGINNLGKSDLDSLPIPTPPLAEQKRIVAKVDELMALCDRLEEQQQERETRHAALARASLTRFAAAPTASSLQYLFHDSVPIPPADLRKAILTLAVQGKLVPQDPNDEPALALLDKVATHKAALAKEGKLRGSTTVKPMVDDEAEFDLPSNWCWVRFGEIMVNRDGERIPVSKEERETKAKTYDYYGASGIIDKIDGYLFDKPLLLIGEDGANLINRSTPIAFIARGKYWVNNHAHVLDGITEDFLRFIELHINAINLEKYVTGSAQPKMNQAKMNSIPIALPPLAEQRRIVAKVEQLMALVDALETQLATSRATAAKLLAALVAELTGTKSTGSASKPAASARRGRPRKST